MRHHCRFACVLLILVALGAVTAADWTQFRGPGGLGVSGDKGLPTKWSSDKNIIWKTKLPGPGTSSPVALGNRIFLTCYSGYALSDKDPGKMEDLRRHLLCVEKSNGKILWKKEFEPVLPEHKYAGEGSYHGYSSSTPTTDGLRLYVFFGKSGVFCFDLAGKQLWQRTVGKGTNGWGSGASPLLYKDLVIVNASVEGSALVALDKLTGKEVWHAPGVRSAWNTPVLVTAPSKELELVISIQDRLLAFDPDTGKELWSADGIHLYVCPSVVAHDGVVYAIGGGHTALAVRAGGRGDVTDTHVLWRTKKGSNVSSPIYHDGHLYWASDSGGIVHCQEAATGKFVYSERLKPDSGLIYASPVLAEGKLYYVSQRNGTYVVAAGPKFELVAHNTIEDDKSRTNASIAVSGGQLLLRTDQYLYCIGNR
jgi:outer membrane protein assembly factor BamB